MREFLLLGHIFFVVIWLGSQITTHVLAIRIGRAGPERTIDFIADLDWLGNRLQGPSALLVLVFGILLVTTGGYPMQTWLVLGLIGWVVIVGIGAGFLVPQTRRILKLAGEHGAGAPDVQAKIKTVLRVSSLDSLLLVVLLLVMIAKPGM